MPRVSVLVNNHNYGRFLGQALQSVLDQRCLIDEVEIIAVDDASTDDSREVLARFAPRVRAALLPEKRGHAAAFNAVFAAATGDIFCLLDSDDWWEPTKLARVVARFDAEKDLGIVQHWCREVGPDGRPVNASSPSTPPRFSPEDFLRGACVFTGTTGLSFRASALRSLLPVPEDLRISADSYLYFSALDAPVGNIPEVLAWRRVHADNRYAGRLRRPDRLREYRRALTVLDRELTRLLAAKGLSLTDEAARGRRAEELFTDMFLARHAGDWNHAKQCWGGLVRQYRGARKLAKAATLSLALASPELYLELQGVYARLRNG